MYGFVHHLLLATTIASVLVLVHTTIVYRALDIGTHYVIASLLGPVERSHLPPGQHPTVLLLTPAVSREMTGALAGLVRRMTTEWRPPVQANLRRVLVVAIDLAPLLDDTSDAERRQQKDLDAALDGCSFRDVRGARTDPSPFTASRPTCRRWACSRLGFAAWPYPEPAPSASVATPVTRTGMSAVTWRRPGPGPPPDSLHR